MDSDTPLDALVRSLRTARPDGETPFSRAVARLAERQRAFARELAVKKEAALRAAYRDGCPSCGCPTHPETLVLHEFAPETFVEGDVLNVTVRFRVFCIRCRPINRI